MQKNTEKITKLMDALKGTEDKSKLKLVKRKKATGYWWSIKDYNQSPTKWLAIGTQDEQVAGRVFTEVTSNISYGQTEVGAIIQLNIAKLDRDMRERTWTDVFISYSSLGQRQSTLNNFNASWNHKDIQPLKNQLLVTTTSRQLLDIYKDFGVNNQKFIQTLHGHAKRMGWLVDNNLMPKVELELHKKACGGTTATITEEQHLKIIAAIEADLANWDTEHRRMRTRCWEKALEVKAMLEMLWELGSSNADTRELTTDNIDWESGHVVFKRKKWKGNGANSKRVRQAIRFPMSVKLKEVIRPWYDDAMKNGGGYLLPEIAVEQSCNASRVFYAYREAAGISPKVKCSDGEERRLIIHSYRYRMAEHLFEIGANEVEAKTLMGWHSKEVMMAYAKGRQMEIPALDVMAKERGHNKIIPMEKVA